MEPLMLARRPNSPLSAPDFCDVYFPKLGLGRKKKKKSPLNTHYKTDGLCA